MEIIMYPLRLRYHYIDILRLLLYEEEKEYDNGK